MAVHEALATTRSLHGVFSRDLVPALVVHPGDRVVVRGLPDAVWNTGSQERPLDPGRLVRIQPPGPEHDGHCMFGPIAVRGARPGDALEVVFHELRTASWAWSVAGGFPSPVNEMLGLDDEPTWAGWEIDAGVAREPGGVSVRTRPFLGVVGMPPPEPGLHSSIPPRCWGGNLDCRELVAGSRLFLPVPVPDALLSIGDGHAAQGDGEVSGVAVECGMDLVDIGILLHSRLRLERPRAITRAGYVTLAMDADVDRAWRTALADMVAWMEELLDVPRARALLLATVAVDLRITQVANGVCGVHALLQRERLEGG